MITKEELAEYDRLLARLDTTLPEVRQKVLKLTIALHIVCLIQADFDIEKSYSLIRYYRNKAEDFYQENKEYLDNYLTD